jgi:hypothetical protein
MCEIDGVSRRRVTYRQWPALSSPSPDFIGLEDVPGVPADTWLFGRKFRASCVTIDAWRAFVFPL